MISFVVSNIVIIIRLFNEIIQIAAISGFVLVSRIVIIIILFNVIRIVIVVKIVC